MNDELPVWRVGMNISRLKELLKPLPDSFDPKELTESHAQELCDELEELLGTVKDVRRQADEAELAATEARAAALRAKLSIDRSQQIAAVPMAARVHQDIDETDAGNGVREPREENHSAQSFRDELAELRDRTQQKRSRLG